MKHKRNHCLPTARHSRLALALACALGSGWAAAQQIRPDVPDVSAQDDASEIQQLREVTVTTSQEPGVRGAVTGVSKEVVEKRAVRNVADLLDEMSGVTLNNLYQRPEVNVKVQGIGGHGRVSQQLEGVPQNFFAFNSTFDQVGTIMIDPLFLKSIDVTQGPVSSTSALGSLAGVANFNYLDVDDVLRPGRNVGGLVRMSSGFSKYRNGQKPAYTGFVAARNDRWQLLVGASDSENDEYRLGRNLDEDEMQKVYPPFQYSFEEIRNGRVAGRTWSPNNANNCKYNSSLRERGIAECGMTPEMVDAVKEANKNPLPGTQKKVGSQMLRLRHVLDDRQMLELLATRSESHYQSNLRPSLRVRNITQDAPPSWQPAYERSYRPDVKNDVESTVFSLKYSGSFSDWLNPEVMLYNEKIDRKQQWQGSFDNSYGWGGWEEGQMMHYFADIGSTGLRLSNASHLHETAIGPLRLDTGLELRRADKKVDSMTEMQWESIHRMKVIPPVVDPNSRTDTMGLSLALSTAGNSPWQASAGMGWQRVSMYVHDATGMFPNMKKISGIYYPHINDEEYLIDPSEGWGNRRLQHQEFKHHWDLKSFSLAVQWTKPGTGFTTYAQTGYGQRAPSSMEMYPATRMYGAELTTSEYLKPESNLSFQLGVNYQKSGLFKPNDRFNVSANLYRNQIKDWIGYGYRVSTGDIVNDSKTSEGDLFRLGGYVNSTETIIRQGLGMNIGYQQPLFYVRGNLTLPFRHANKFCAWTAPGGAYRSTTLPNGGMVISDMGRGDIDCMNTWNWAEFNGHQVEGSLTAALTPKNAQWEFGATLHFYGKQTADYWFNASVGEGKVAKGYGNYPEQDGFIRNYRWPSVLKVDLFAGYRFNDQLRMGIYLANATDQLHLTPLSGREDGSIFYPGRTLTANLEYRF